MTEHGLIPKSNFNGVYTIWNPTPLTARRAFVTRRARRICRFNATSAAMQRTNLPRPGYGYEVDAYTPVGDTLAPASASRRLLVGAKTFCSHRSPIPFGNGKFGGLLALIMTEFLGRASRGVDSLQRHRR
jgi:hypothetical protein